MCSTYQPASASLSRIRPRSPPQNMNRFRSRRNRDRFQSRSLFYPILFFGCFGFALLYMFFHTKSLPSPGDAGEGMPRSIYDITVKGISGKDVTLSTYSGKVLLLVNVASKCGFTDLNYKEMNVLYKKYRSKGFEILAFPCNQFGGQEPGTNEEIEKTCKALRAEFPIFEKVEVNGNNASALYKFLKAQKDGIFGDSIKWNFTKFLVDKYGKVVQRYAPTTSPLQFEDDIKILLGVL